jgi:hypothetical protein
LAISNDLYSTVVSGEEKTSALLSISLGALQEAATLSKDGFDVNFLQRIDSSVNTMTERYAIAQLLLTPPATCNQRRFKINWISTSSCCTSCKWLNIKELLPVK